jgi:hypothetical protein
LNIERPTSNIEVEENEGAACSRSVHILPTSSITGWAMGPRGADAFRNFEPRMDANECEKTKFVDTALIGWVFI